MPEDKRIALAALAVTAVVGVASPLGTVIATNAHDSKRLRDERLQSDRSELRQVLDNTVAELTVVGDRLVRLQTNITRDAVTRAERGPHRYRLSPVAQAEARSNPYTLSRISAIQELAQLYSLLSHSYIRVAIRLGRQAPTTNQFKALRATEKELEAAMLKLLETSFDANRYRALEDKVTGLVRRYYDQTDLVIDKAHRVAHSATG